MSRAYYNEIDPCAAQWLRNLIAEGLIAPGDVDDRSIKDVRPDDLAGYSQCHFFAGTGGWSLALRLAEWPDDRPVWTGSCPCQPFSAAGAGKAANDERHLWPTWFPLIAERRPAVVFGEQVEAAIGWGWLDVVFADLEQEGYACGATVLPACGVGAPHIRQRAWFVADTQCAERRPLDSACRDEGRNRLPSGQEGSGRTRSHIKDGRLADADGGNASAERLQRGGQHGQRSEDCGPSVGMAHAPSARCDGALGKSESETRHETRMRLSGEDCANGGMGDANRQGLPERKRDGRIQRETMGPCERETSFGGGNAGFWADAQFIPCTEGKARPIEPGSFPLAHGIRARPSKLRAYGNAIVPQVAAQFIAAFLELRAAA